MNHQPFETWLFVEEPLPPEQELALQEHLQGCIRCTELAEAWRGVLPVLESRQLAEPADGFTSRWKERLERERLALQRRQSWFVFSVSMGGASVFLLMIVALVLFSYRSPVEWLLAVVSRFAGLISFANALQSAADVMNKIVHPGWWLVMAGMALLPAVLWIISLQRVTVTRRISS